MEIVQQIDSFCFFVKQAESKPFIDVDKLDSPSLSATMRYLNKKYDFDHVQDFLSIYKKVFDKFAKEDVHSKNLEKDSIQEAIKIFNSIKKEASDTSNDARLIATHLVNIIGLLLQRIKPENRNKAKLSVKNKLRIVNYLDIANKKMPPSSAIGQSIGFVKNVLFNRNPEFVRQTLNAIVEKL